MSCPKCKKSSACGCNSCKERCTDSTIIRHELGTEEGWDFIKCPYCGVKSHPDAWLDSEWEDRTNFMIENKSFTEVRKSDFSKHYSKKEDGFFHSINDDEVLKMEEVIGGLMKDKLRIID